MYLKNIVLLLITQIHVLYLLHNTENYFFKYAIMTINEPFQVAIQMYQLETDSPQLTKAHDKCRTHFTQKSTWFCLCLSLCALDLGMVRIRIERRV